MELIMDIHLRKYTETYFRDYVEGKHERSTRFRRCRLMRTASYLW